MTTVSSQSPWNAPILYRLTAAGASNGGAAPDDNEIVTKFASYFVGPTS